MTFRTWSEDEVGMLTDFYFQIGAAGMAALLKRSKEDVEAKADELWLHMPPRDPDEPRNTVTMSNVLSVRW